MSTSARALPSPFVAVVGYTLRACLPLKRWFGVLLPCLGALLFGMLANVIDETPDEAFSAISENGLFGLVLPLTCLVIGDAVLGADLRAGTFQLTWLSPVSFANVALGRWLGGWLIALLTLVPALVLASAIAGVADEAAGPMALAGAAGSAAYVALFLMLGVLVKRSTVWALAIVLVGERLLGTELSGIAQLSPLWESQQTFAGLWDYGPDLERSGMPAGWAAVARLALITAVCLLVAVWRLAHMKPLAGDD
jgi:ABC-type transport system involved in multi-copper enzyme maturation permease subunit